ncbi:MAG TPA: hypothetical protein VL098_12885 [Flavipsychrobacter sp.]|nr:hypothetical protein [Flavipsychrobacter sp.]
MLTGLLHLHNLMRWVLIILMLVNIVKAAGGMSGNKAFTTGDKRNALFMMISADIQLLLGLALYFMGPWGIKNIQNQGMGNVMKDATGRFFAIEHTMGMLIGIVLIHIGYAAVKKNIADNAKFKKVFWFTLIAAIVMIASVPWPFREGMGRPWFPGM